MSGKNHSESGGTSQETENDVHARRETRCTKRDYRRVVKGKEVELGIGEWSSPCFPVATKTRGKWRWVVDMRHVNEQCVEDS